MYLFSSSLCNNEHGRTYIINKVMIIQTVLLLTMLTGWMPYKSVTYQRIKKWNEMYCKFINVHGD